MTPFEASAGLASLLAPIDDPQKVMAARLDGWSLVQCDLAAVLETPNAT